VSDSDLPRHFGEPPPMPRDLGVVLPKLGFACAVLLEDRSQAHEISDVPQLLISLALSASLLEASAVSGSALSHRSLLHLSRVRERHLAGGLHRSLVRGSQADLRVR